MNPCPPLRQLLADAGKLRAFLFLDYDGTLADFAPNPDVVLPDAHLLDLLSRLVERDDLRLAVVSGRRLTHVRALLPLPGVWLAGSYGLELVDPGGAEMQRLDYQALRPRLAAFKPGWQRLLAGRDGFYLEDKGWALAIHADKAQAQAAAEVLAQARMVEVPAGFRLQGGERFLEVCPPEADKGAAVEYILSRSDLDGVLPLFIGDDDKDERAFTRLQAGGGIGILVAPRARPTTARYRLASPHAVRRWLRAYLG
ncbi:MAG: trehalose-phosphatase [Anaerolineae bacterium]|nr:trehalose-phosphatase [Anaerolineae bacterium]